MMFKPAVAITDEFSIKTRDKAVARATVGENRRAYGLAASAAKPSR